MIPKQQVIDAVAKETEWVVEQRMAKLRGEHLDSMSVNPLLIPILYDLHAAPSFKELGTLLLAGHLMAGHNTSFGKLVDEKILPNVFGTLKLNVSYRRNNVPLIESCFNEIDHIVLRPSKLPALLSLKASKWTIQLTAATQLNHAFSVILSKYPDRYSEIVVGVFTGKTGTLTDKYDILRGINRGANHDVIDLRESVSVYAGREFWAWLNGDEQETQDWVLDGVLRGLQNANIREDCDELLLNFANAFQSLYAKHIKEDGAVDWHAILREVNG